MHGKRVNTATVRQTKLFGVDAHERLIADLFGIVLRLLSGQKVTEGDVHLARLKAFLTEYTERQRSDFELGLEEECNECEDDEPGA